MSRMEPICAAAIGIAVCCALSMSMRIPLGIGHISADLGYLALAVYAYASGSISAAVVGGCYAAVMSVLSGWFSLEWILANVTVGLICGRFYDRTGTRRAMLRNIGLTVAAAAAGMLLVKTAVACLTLSVPVAVKLPKSVAAWITDSIVMCAGLPLARRVHGIKTGT